jgi:hypothetical protein
MAHAAQELTIVEQAQSIADKKLALLRAVLENRRKTAELPVDGHPEAATIVEYVKG